MSGGGVDMVIDSVGEASWAESLKSLRRGGRLVTCGATTGANPPADMQRVFIRQLEIYGSTGGSVGEFRQLLDVFARGLVKPVIDSHIQDGGLRSAFDRLHAGAQFGKVSLVVSRRGRAAWVLPRQGSHLAGAIHWRQQRIAGERPA